jgi:hypothetical protein
MSIQRIRQSDRVSISIPVEVFGTDFTGEHFVERTRTVLVSRHGATIILNRKLAPDHELILKRVGANREALVRVVGQIGGRPEGYIYGVALQDLGTNLWNIYFPTITEAEKAVARALLECSHCRNREVVYLNEVETEVFEANLCLTRVCKPCGGSSIWKLTPHELADEPLPDPVPKNPPAALAEPPISPRAQSKRKNLRIQSNMKACIRQPGFDELIVTCEDASRGGICFRSPKRYFMGSRIEVAMPYAAGTANIFVPARIVYAQELQTEAAFKYGVAYLKK